MTFAILTRVRHSVGTYGRYITEICLSEGLADQVATDLDALRAFGSTAQLDRFGTLVVAECSLTSDEIAYLIGRIERGATVIAIRPSRPLAKALGLRPLDHHLPDAYVAASPDQPETAGLPVTAVQSLVPLDHYRPEQEVRTLAAAWSDANTPAGRPAVFAFARGAGQVVIFGYDVSRSVARLRHGEAALVGTRSQGGLPFRCTDLMLDQVDRSTWHVPQADIHAQLLTNVITATSREPVVRWWYYPEPEMRTVVVQDCDDDWSTPEQFEMMADAADRHGFRTTFYLMMGAKPTFLDDSRIIDLTAAGHSFGIHHDGLAGWEDGEDQNLVLEQVIRTDVEKFRSRFGHPPVANRNHALVWFGSDELPRLYDELGIRMEFNAQGPPDCGLNYLAGSARPIRHVAGDGTVLNVFQQPTQVYDDSALIERLGGAPEAEAATVRRHLLRLLESGHGPLSMQSHPVSFAMYSQKFFELVWSATRELGIEIWSAEEWARYCCSRYASVIDGNHDNLTLSVLTVSTARRQTLLVPRSSAGAVQADGVAVTSSLTVHGLEYWSVPLSASADGIRHHVELTAPQLEDHS